jgi:hypothetical protein
VTFPALLRRGGQELVTIALKGIGSIDWYQCGVVNKVSAEALCAVEASMAAYVGGLCRRDGSECGVVG